MTMIAPILALALVATCHAFPTGAPGLACENMTPIHLAFPQTGNAPYSLTLSKLTYTAGEVINVTLSGNGDTKFRGFLVQPRTSDGSYKTVGKLIPISEGMQNNCGENAALTHTNNNDKTEVQFMWKAPDQDAGAVIIEHTVVQVRTTFWVKNKSSEITFANN